MNAPTPRATVADDLNLLLPLRVQRNVAAESVYPGDGVDHGDGNHQTEHDQARVEIVDREEHQTPHEADDHREEYRHLFFEKLDELTNHVDACGDLADVRAFAPLIANRPLGHPGVESGEQTCVVELTECADSDVGEPDADEGPDLRRLPLDQAVHRDADGPRKRQLGEVLEKTQRVGERDRDGLPSEVSERRVRSSFG